jgi:hypothetical protein
LIEDYFSSPRNFNETWNGPIFQEEIESKTESEVDPFQINNHFHSFLSQLNSVSEIV